MKRTSSILLIVSLATVVRGGLTTDTLGVKGPVVDQGIITDTLGFDGGDGPDYVTPIGPGPGSILVGSDAADSFDGGDGPDYLQPIRLGKGNALVGSDAADSLVGSDAADSFDGGDGPDYLVGSDAADSFDGGDGPDYLQPIRLGKGNALVGSDAADSLVGSDAADSFDGGDGPDYLVGSDAADSFDGGDGPDYVYEMIEMALSSAGGLPVTLQDLFALPGVFAALHAKGPVGDELRGYVDWLMMTGELLGGPGSDKGTFLEEGPAPTGEINRVQPPYELVKDFETELGLWVEKGTR